MSPVSEELTSKSARELVRLIRSREVSPVEVMEAHLRRIERLNPSLNAIVTIADDAIDQARGAEEAIIKGSEVGPLYGLPITVKDTIETAGLRTTAGSGLFRDNVPQRNATAVARLKAAGAIVLGKTNVPEMAIPFECENPLFSRTNNPRDVTKTSGGSSGGEAAAIAAHLSPVGVGSDLSGSIRVPAHFCGIAGLKPTTDRVPIDGHIPAVIGPLALGACVGPMARCVDDLSFLFEVMAQTKIEDLPGERTSVAFYVDDGVTPVSEETEVTIRKAARILSDVGYQVRDERAPGVSQGPRLWVELFSRTSAEQLSKAYLNNEGGPLVRSVLQKFAEDADTPVEKAERLAKAVVEREGLRETLLRWMKVTPLILSPVGAVPAFEHGAKRVQVRGESISVFRAFSYSQTFNVFGLPSVSVPAGYSPDGLPIGVQIVGRPFEEARVLAAARIIESADN